MFIPHAAHVCGFEFSCSSKPQCHTVAVQCRQQTANATHIHIPRLLNSFHVRYEDDTEKANDKKAAQLRNKVKRNCVLKKRAQMMMLAFCGFQERGRLRRQHSFQNGHVTIYEADRWSCCLIWSLSILCPVDQRQYQRRWNWARMSAASSRNWNSLPVNLSPLPARFASRFFHFK